METHDDNEKISSLRVHEWLAIALVLGFLVGLTTLTSINRSRESVKLNCELYSRQFSGFDVYIKGAVDHPGVYHIQSEMKMRKLLNLAQLKSHADIRRFNPETVVKKSRVINVPAKEMITITLKGAVKAQKSLSLPKNSRLEDLITQGEFSDDADLNALKKKRRLKAGEVVVVPFVKK